MIISKPLSSRLLSRATSVKETSGDILERLRLLGCDPKYVDKIVGESENKLPKGTKELWSKRSIEVDEKGVIHVKFFSSPQWWSYPLNFDVK